MKKSIISFTVNNNGKIQKDLIEFKDNSFYEDSINFKDFKNILKKIEDKNFKYEDYFNLIDNYNKLIHFLENIKKIIKKKFKNIELEIQLDIQEIEQKNNNLIKNILCKYILIKPSLTNIKSYTDKNVLSLEKYDNFELFLNNIKKLIKD